MPHRNRRLEPITVTECGCAVAKLTDLSWQSFESVTCRVWILRLQKMFSGSTQKSALLSSAKTCFHYGCSRSEMGAQQVPSIERRETSGWMQNYLILCSGCDSLRLFFRLRVSRGTRQLFGSVAVAGLQQQASTPGSRRHGSPICPIRRHLDINNRNP